MHLIGMLFFLTESAISTTAGTSVFPSFPGKPDSQKQQNYN